MKMDFCENAKFNEISLEGAVKIGIGAHSIAYRFARDKIVKAYHSRVTLEDIEREKACAEWAFANGIPTARPYEIVRVGDGYGAVYEYIEGVLATDYIKKSSNHLRHYIRKSVELMKKVHAIEVSSGELPDRKLQTLSLVDVCGNYLPSGVCDDLKELVEKIPDRSNLLHGDVHVRNVMLRDDELILLDMETLSTGDPIFDLSAICNVYKEYPAVASRAAMRLGIDVKTAYHIWYHTLSEYLENAGEEEMRNVSRKARILGCIVILDLMDRFKEQPDREKFIDFSVREIETLL
ncbi:MAG: phosphotransferase [Butyrivibrio sp.]|nr:phosphotransferase [Butyrivibrio sp.]